MNDQKNEVAKNVLIVSVKLRQLNLSEIGENSILLGTSLCDYMINGCDWGKCVSTCASLTLTRLVSLPARYLCDS